MEANEQTKLATKQANNQCRQNYAQNVLPLVSTPIHNPLSTNHYQSPSPLPPPPDLDSCRRAAAGARLASVVAGGAGRYDARQQFRCAPATVRVQLLGLAVSAVSTGENSFLWWWRAGHTSLRWPRPVPACRPLLPPPPRVTVAAVCPWPPPRLEGLSTSRM